ncbi:prostaglandin D2 receptor isoform X1 [Marmota flaviventris]|uniref:prostaglandin D2 receptor isoform X1 n=1 Tax=Marmota flaviventris TaxID=93162 RepID=UPI003A839478
MKSPFYPCQNTTSVEKGNSATMGGVLFSAGLLGNLLALGLLARSGLGSCRPRPPRPPPSVFYVLVCGLTITDLLGKCLISPVVLAAYAQNRSLRGLMPASGDESLCQTFAFFMSFFGLASTLQLLAMALECWLSLGHPFFYQRHITLRRGVLVAPVVGAFCLAFCALPLMGFGKFIQYCPGTWCFIRMVRDDSIWVVVYSVLYSTLMALVVLAIVLCNLGAMRNLYTMHQRLRRHTRCGLRDIAEPGAGKKVASSHPLEELDHLLLLALMTVLFTMCSVPLINPWNRRSGRGHPACIETDLILSSRFSSYHLTSDFTKIAQKYRSYYGAVQDTTEESDDLLALRFLSVISIVDPWIFIIFRTSVFRMFFHKIFIRPLMYRNWQSHSYQTNVESSL